MATDPDFCGLGLGRKILEKSFEVLKEKKCERLWFNAREVAYEFYTKCGFEFHGGTFNISDTGPHRVMFKKF